MIGQSKQHLNVCLLFCNLEKIAIVIFPGNVFFQFLSSERLVLDPEDDAYYLWMVYILCFDLNNLNV